MRKCSRILAYIFLMNKLFFNELPIFFVPSIFTLILRLSKWRFLDNIYMFG